LSDKFAYLCAEINYIEKEMRIGLFFGSFNPIHIGHLIIANHSVAYTDLQQVWLVVSPHNPHKAKSTLARDYDRLHLVRLAIEDNQALRACDIEFGLPQPSYTIDTLAYLTEKYPQHEFSLIMGGDNLAGLDKWKNYEQILARYSIYVYTRPSVEMATPLTDHPNVHILDNVPLMNISATFVREAIKKGRSIQYIVPECVSDYIAAAGLYKK
jgi:nicotinate-nucleotide adenylyltransferase